MSKYTLNNECVTKISILNSKNQIVKTISGNKKGSVIDYWNLKDNKGKLVNNGKYKIVFPPVGR